VLEEVIRKADLPLRATYTPPQIGIRFSDLEGNPISGPSTDGFECQLPSSDAADLLRRADAALEVLSSPTRYGITWTALSRTDDQMAAKALYTALQAAGLPAQSYEIRFEFIAESLADLAAIRPLVVKGAEIEAPLWGFDLPEKESGELSVVVKPDGYDLQFFIPDASRAMIESKLGLKLVEAPDED
jgi:hypothetical protein